MLQQNTSPKQVIESSYNIEVTMKWRKLGKVFDVNNSTPDGYMVSHAMMPCPYHIKGDIYRIYFSSRDITNRSRPFSIDMNINFPLETFGLSKEPILDLGELGCYDDSGVMPTCIYNVGDDKYMIFNGWSLGLNVPFYSFNGLAKEVSDKFVKQSRYPNVLSRSSSDPISTFSPFVLYDEGKWKMWYVSLIRWSQDKKHYYHIKYAESFDGINWTPKNHVCIDFESKSEFAIARPCVIKVKDHYKMWYSYRGDKYRIGYAESSDGLVWNRMDSYSGLSVSDDGWDSEMVEYAYVFGHKGKLYMLYNGNDYGKSGFGIAIEDNE